VQRTVSSRQNPAPHQAVSTADLLNSYSAAYALMGNYCGGGEQRIQAELMAVARAILRHAGLD
jgi:hypothetical protein